MPCCSRRRTSPPPSPPPRRPPPPPPPRAAPRRGGTVTVRLRPIEGRARFEVEDECGGLPPGAAERLFDPFVQLGPDRSGFGLGLAIARQAVEAHGGNLAVHDLQGKGCVFLLEIPASASAA